MSEKQKFHGILSYQLLFVGSKSEGKYLTLQEEIDEEIREDTKRRGHDHSYPAAIHSLLWPAQAEKSVFGLQRRIEAQTQA